ncbi:putative CSC1-like protein RXW8 [Sesbania bispinosa]|nr:putative CSC1-like protein RXW8 [Sesbania bispinosa]
MDRRDEQSGRMKEIYEQLHSAYNQFSLVPHASSKPECFKSAPRTRGVLSLQKILRKARN